MDEREQLRAKVPEIQRERRRRMIREALAGKPKSQQDVPKQGVKRGATPDKSMIVGAEETNKRRKLNATPTTPLANANVQPVDSLGNAAMSHAGLSFNQNGTAGLSGNVPMNRPGLSFSHNGTASLSGIVPMNYPRPSFNYTGTVGSLGSMAMNHPGPSFNPTSPVGRRGNVPMSRVGPYFNPNGTVGSFGNVVMSHTGQTVDPDGTVDPRNIMIQQPIPQVDASSNIDNNNDVGENTGNNTGSTRKRRQTGKTGRGSVTPSTRITRSHTKAAERANVADAPQTAKNADDALNTDRKSSTVNRQIFADAGHGGINPQPTNATPKKRGKAVADPVTPKHQIADLSYSDSPLPSMNSNSASVPCQTSRVGTPQTATPSVTPWDQQLIQVVAHTERSDMWRNVSRAIALVTGHSVDPITCRNRMMQMQKVAKRTAEMQRQQELVAQFGRGIVGGPWSTLRPAPPTPFNTFVPNTSLPIPFKPNGLVPTGFNPTSFVPTAAGSSQRSVPGQGSGPIPQLLEAPSFLSEQIQTTQKPVANLHVNATTAGETSNQTGHENTETTVME